MRKALGTISFVLLALAPSARADVVQINSGKGYGFLFHYGQECLLLLPEHVHGDRYSLKFQGADPRERGRAVVSDQRIDELDLSLAAVSGGVADNCGSDWFRLTGATDADRLESITLRRIEGQGVRTNTPMFVLEEGPTRLRAQIAPGVKATPIYQGTSGAMAFVGEVPVGMAIQAPDEETAIFLRFPKILKAIAAVKGFDMRPRKDPEFKSGLSPVGGPIDNGPPVTIGVDTTRTPQFLPLELSGSEDASN